MKILKTKKITLSKISGRPTFELCFTLANKLYPNNAIIVSNADIYFNEKGYSDKAIIHLENDDNEKFSFLIEPFLLRVRLYNSYAGFED